ncbi:MAG: hypothetical protein ACRDGG_11540 [Anaerolineae bacterium]
MAIAFVALSLSVRDWDARSFALIGKRFEQSDPTGNRGYDGQFAYYIAIDPIGAARTMDAAAYRYLRIVYPALGWLLSLGGQAALVPWMLIAVNVIALGAIASLLGDLLEWHAASRWYALVAPLTAGMLFALRADLNEPLALALALGAVTILSRSGRHLPPLLRYGDLRETPPTQMPRTGAVTILLALSALTKETGYVYAGGVVLWLLASRHWRTAIGVGLGSLGPSIVWGALVSAWLGQSPFATERTRFEAIPFGGLRFTEPAQAQLILVLWIVIPSIVLTLALARDALRGRRGLSAFLLGANVLFVTFMPRASYIDTFAVMRLAGGMMAASLIWLAATDRRRWLPYFAGLWAPSGLLLLILPGVLAACAPLSGVG